MTNDETIERCPACGQPGELHGTRLVMCSDTACSFSCAVPVWQRLSRAARLLAAVEGLQTAYGNSFSVCQRTDGMWEANTLTDAMIADTAANALIALGEALNE